MKYALSFWLTVVKFSFESSSYEILESHGQLIVYVGVENDEIVLDTNVVLNFNIGTLSNATKGQRFINKIYFSLLKLTSSVMVFVFFLVTQVVTILLVPLRSHSEIYRCILSGQ